MAGASARRSSARADRPAPRRALHESRAAHADDLHADGRHRLSRAKDQRIPRRQIIGAGALQGTKVAPLQEHAAIGGQRVPRRGIEILDRVGQCEAEAGGAMALAMTLPSVGQARAEAA